MRILFVDDDPHLLQGIRRLLHGRREWTTAFAGSGQQALAMMTEAPFDVLVSDMRMPEMDGLELLEEVQRRHPHTLRIVLTGYVDSERAAAAQSIAQAWLHKPCDPQALAAAIAAQ